MIDYQYARYKMVERQLASRGISDPRVLSAMQAVPREVFVEEGFQEFAYEDSPLPIAEGQTISQPYIVACMAEAAQIEPDDNVLEVGAGSGYAAAVLSYLARYVFAIERHETLATNAAARLAKLERHNVEVQSGDGTKGFANKAPFDAIVVSAGGPTVPVALKEQLEIGGRLIIPIGPQDRSQRLIRITRRAAGHYDEEDLGGVSFVPLVVAHGWKDDTRHADLERHLPDLIRQAAESLPAPEDPRFADPFARFANRRVVLLGEASHGTSEFHQARAVITRRLVERHGFSIVAVEADWPDAAAMNRFVRVDERKTENPPFQRFPSWMWRNTDVFAFLAWLREHNATASANEQAGFYGLDIYNMRGSIAAVLDYLDKADPKAAAVARERYGCLTPWQNAPHTYGRATLTDAYRSCEDAVTRQCGELLRHALKESRDDTLFDAAQNARLVTAAEKYYRIMYYGGAEAWNLRDRHMFETLEHLLDRAGPNSKAVVWAHNSHIGDARHTEMGKVRGELSLGQLCREKFADEVALIGFGTHVGTVAAATDWDGEMEVKRVRPSLEESVERCCHLSRSTRFLLDFARHAELANLLAHERLERFIGVIYRPGTERLSHYANVELSKQFDAYVWFDETHAITPISPQATSGPVPDTFPSGL
ncbi:protein-L-isoaspartate(D-aspartate) O-methyltransferase [Rhizobium cauense]|uniref:protein-L-isoaspartate(D-aspartate) O-methyltransferase n=1 Tax=Rhizobium cauense TaxID=1166683 RepID=UPI001C6E184D|nr:protein-L-isoaspartate(D-aspartate) O-methyltransferase [Rhizobium cauense]MBW9117707.1 protein-L-isoaspartate(D-aspartate) O-methyltransferase [Rhizobium cauense]